MQWRRRRIVAESQRKFADKTVAETFAEIYEKNVWGGERSEFYSGEGSTERYSEKYALTITKFIGENNIKRVVDLGCGDFRVASRFVAGDFHYTGCDVVPSLVEHLNRNFANEKIEFCCLNIVEDELPDGDLCLSPKVSENSPIKRLRKRSPRFMKKTSGAAKEANFIRVKVQPKDIRKNTRFYSSAASDVYKSQGL